VFTKRVEVTVAFNSRGAIVCVPLNCKARPCD
jgi:hypothetical protein